MCIKEKTLLIIVGSLYTKSLMKINLVFDVKVVDRKTSVNSVDVFSYNFV